MPFQLHCPEITEAPHARLFLTELPHNAALVGIAEEYGLVPDEIHHVLEKGAS